MRVRRRALRRRLRTADLPSTMDVDDGIRSLRSSPLAARVPTLAAAQPRKAPARLRRSPSPASAEPPLAIGGFGDMPLSTHAAAGQRRSSSRAACATPACSGSPTSRASTPRSATPTTPRATGTTLTVRGFVIDNRFNYRRDGLPINAETSIPLDNKERHRAAEGHERHAGRHQRAGRPGQLRRQAAAGDAAALGDARLARSAAALLRRGRPEPALRRRRRFGVRVNAAPSTSTRSMRDAAATATCSRSPATGALGRDTLVEAEVETSHRSQPSVPGFSLLGDAVPDAGASTRASTSTTSRGRCRSCSTATTASLRLTQQLGADWRWSRIAATQRLRSDDRIAFPFGCSAPSTTLDRYCSDGTLRLLRLPQRQRAPPQRRARRRRWHGRAHDRRASTHQLQRRRAAHRSTARASSRRPSTSPASATSTARAVVAARAGRRSPRTPTATSARPSSTLRDALQLRRAPAPGSARATRASSAAASHRRLAEPDALLAVVHHAVAGAEPRVRAAGTWSTRAGAAASSPTWRRTCRATRTPARRCRR